MNDQDYIRKGIELADGFSEDASGFARHDLDEGHLLGNEIYLDALAAQLTRQVDALEETRFSCAVNKSVLVHTGDPMAGYSTGKRGPDRTMNTIKAIVDSGVINEK